MGITNSKKKSSYHFCSFCFLLSFPKKVRYSLKFTFVLYHPKSFSLCSFFIIQNKKAPPIVGISFFLKNVFFSLEVSKKYTHWFSFFLNKKRKKKNFLFLNKLKRRSLALF